MLPQLRVRGHFTTMIFLYPHVATQSQTSWILQPLFVVGMHFMSMIRETRPRRSLGFGFKFGFPLQDFFESDGPLDSQLNFNNVFQHMNKISDECCNGVASWIYLWLYSPESSWATNNHFSCKTLRWVGEYLDNQNFQLWPTSVSQLDPYKGIAR